MCVRVCALSFRLPMSVYVVSWVCIFVYATLRVCCDRLRELRTLKGDRAGPGKADFHLLSGHYALHRMLLIRVVCVCVYVSTLTPQHHAYVFITVQDQRSCSSLTVCRCVVYAVQRKRGPRTVCWDMRHEYLWARCQKLFLPLCRLLIPAIYYTHYVSVIWMNDVREFHIRRRSMRRHARAPTVFFLYVFETVEIWRYWLFMGDKCDAIWLLLRCVCSPLQYSNEYNKREMDG